MERSANEIAYTKAQLHTYLNFINLSSKASIYPKPSISWLQELIRHQISTIPFDNLIMHYSNSHLPSLDPKVIYKRVIGTNKGGICVELNSFFGSMLVALGFEVSKHGARVHAAAGGDRGDWYYGWTHMINCVYLDGKSYLVDVGFGGPDGPIAPLPLDLNTITAGVGNQEFRLSKVENRQWDTEKLWVCEQKTSQDQLFKPVYAFTLTEFTHQDFEIIMWYCSTNKKSWFTQKVICAKYTMEDEQITGRIILNGHKFYQQVKDTVETLTTAKNEKERIMGLKLYFNIDMTPEEVKGIVTLPSKLPE